MLINKNNKIIIQKKPTSFGLALVFTMAFGLIMKTISTIGNANAIGIDNATKIEGIAKTEEIAERGEVEDGAEAVVENSAFFS